MLPRMGMVPPSDDQDVSLQIDGIWDHVPEEEAVTISSYIV